MPGMSSYSLSKLCSIRLCEYLDTGTSPLPPRNLKYAYSIITEHTKLRTFVVHPGIVAQTETKRGMVVDSLTPFALDKGLQAGGVTLYLSTPQADYLRGGFLSVNCKYTICQETNHRLIVKGTLMSSLHTSKKSLTVN